jgi:HlyD family secretion protein
MTTRRAFERSDDPERRRSRERRRALAKKLRTALLGALALAALGIAALALRPSPVPVDVARVVRSPLAVVIEESGVTRVKDRYVVSAPVTGSVSRISLEPGDAVKEADTLAEIAPASSPLLDERTRAEAEARLGAALSGLGQARAQVQRAKAARELADQELGRTRKLAASGTLSAEALEQADFAARMRAEELSSTQFAEKVAAEQVRSARVVLGRDGAQGRRERHVDVLAPVSGQVLRLQQESAGIVQAGAPLLEVGDPQALEIAVDLLTTDAVHVRPGTEAVITGWGGERPLAGRVSRVEPSGFTRPSALGVDEQRVNVIIALTEPREHWTALGDGYRVEARIVLWQSDSVAQVPHGAVFRHGDGWAAYRVVRERAEVVSVRLGHRGENAVEIVSGLAANDMVVVHPGDRLANGARVEVR